MILPLHTCKRSSGQLALDLLLSLLVLLIVLSALNPVLSQFDSTHKEITLHQQLRSNGISIQYLLSSSSAYTRENFSYPANPGVASIVAPFVHSPGSISLSPIHSLGTPQGFACGLPDFDWGSSDEEADSLTLSLFAQDTQLPADLTHTFSFYAPMGYDSMHAFSLNQCYGPLTIEEASP